MKHFNRLVFKSKGFGGGTIAQTRYSNGWGASVITGGYGSESAPYELAVIGQGGSLDYSTDITDDVVGWQTASEIDALLKRIEELK